MHTSCFLTSLHALQIGYFHGYIDGVDYVFVDHPCFHNLGENIYGGDRMQIAFRCALLCKAALEAVWHVPCGGVHYGDDNLVYIANDWHTALLPVYLQVCLSPVLCTLCIDQLIIFSILGGNWDPADMISAQ